MPTDIKPFLVIALVALVIGYRLYRSVRRNIGRQHLQRGWLTLRAVSLLAVAGLLFALSPGLTAVVITGASLGAMIGAGIAAYALMHTRIERTGQGDFYTAHPYIGLGVVGLFVARLVFNLAMVVPKLQGIAAQAHANPAARQAIALQSATGPLTLGIFALMVSYYVVFSLGLLRLAK